MAEEQVGFGKESVREMSPWIKIFSAFKVALDPKKLLLAAAGIFVMALGWWLLATFFYTMHRKPKLTDYTAQVGEGRSYRTEEDAFKSFKQDLNNWNLLHKLAGPVSEQPYEIGDFTNDLNQYKRVEQEIQTIRADIKRKTRPLSIKVDEANQDEQVIISLDDVRVFFKPGGVKPKKLQESLDKKVEAEKIITAYNATPGADKIELEGYTLTFAKVGAEKQAEWQKFQNYVNNPKTLNDIQNEIVEGKRKQPEDTRIALKVLRLEDAKWYKPAGYLSTWPWFEHRGPNPFLLATGLAATSLEAKTDPTGTGSTILGWLFTEQIPVLLEPLVKFLSPVIYFLHPAAYFWTKIYLLLVILWTIATWSFFGGAITRMAAVQVARPTERVSLTEAIRFSVSRYRAFVAAQLLPFAFLAGIALILVIFGFFEILIPVLGDILIAGLGFPLVLLMGLIMAVVLIGLVGWPLMFATISTEGSDSFDAISRSYSYVFQAPWQYLWYGFLALVYGAVLVFFVGLMGSLMVYLGKWGMSTAPVTWELREPSYLFRFAPTSYGWRDLLLHQSPYVTTEEMIQTTGKVTPTYVLQKDYVKQLQFYNDAGSSLVAFWIYLLFLMIIGFGYSFFWTASAIIYLLMRRKVDDTEMDEVHLEEDEVETPYTPPATAPAPAAAGKPTVSLNVVEPPPQTAVATPAQPVAPSSGKGTIDGEPGSAREESASMPGGSPKKTQLAPSEGTEEENEEKRKEGESGSSSGATS